MNKILPPPAFEDGQGRKFASGYFDSEGEKYSATSDANAQSESAECDTIECQLLCGLFAS
jgi:hypothetical protein